MAVHNQVTSSEAEKNALQAQVTDLTTRLQDVRVYVADLEEENVSHAGTSYKPAFTRFFLISVP